MPMTAALAPHVVYSALICKRPHNRMSMHAQMQQDRGELSRANGLSAEETFLEKPAAAEANASAHASAPLATRQHLIPSHASASCPPAQLGTQRTHQADTGRAVCAVCTACSGISSPVTTSLRRGCWISEAARGRSPTLPHLHIVVAEVAAPGRAFAGTITWFGTLQALGGPSEGFYTASARLRCSFRSQRRMAGSAQDWTQSSQGTTACTAGPAACRRCLLGLNHKL